MSTEPKNTWDPEWIDDVCERVYKIRLEEQSGGGPGSVERMIADDKDHGQKLRGRARCYTGAVRAAIEALGIHPVKPNDRWEVNV